MLKHDKMIISDLAKEIKDISQKSEQHENKLHWQKINDLHGTLPTMLVWEDELPWDELEKENELKLHCVSVFGREQEKILRRKLYLWNHFRGNMVVESKLNLKPIYRDSMFGISEVGSQVYYNDSVKYIKYQQQIFSKNDIIKIKFPLLKYSKEENEEYINKLQYLYNDILQVELGVTRFNFSAWHFIIKWLGSEAFYSLIKTDNELLHEKINHVTKGYLERLKQMEAYNIVRNNVGNYICGSGGLTYITGSKCYSNNIIDLWGSTTSQVFEGTSPQTQKWLGVEYEKMWLERFAYSYYGCCETLSDRIDILSEIKNLRKISISPWSNLDDAVQCIERKYVLSYKVNPSKFINPCWNIKEEQIEFKKILKQLIKCSSEIIIKDISTFGGHPERVTQWLNMAKIEMEYI